MWEFMSSDIENISLHDNSIDQIQLADNDILLIFNEGFDVHNAHPLNDTGKAKRTTASQIILSDARLIGGVIHHHNMQSNQVGDECISISWLLETAWQFEVSDWSLKYDPEKGTATLHGYMHLANPYKQEFAELTFACGGAVFCWNGYVGDAWFEGWP